MACVDWGRRFLEAHQFVRRCPSLLTQNGKRPIRQNEGSCQVNHPKAAKKMVHIALPGMDDLPSREIGRAHV